MQRLVPTRADADIGQTMAQQEKEAMFRFVTSRQSFFLTAGIAASVILAFTIALYVGKKYIALRHSLDPLNGQAMLTSKSDWARPVR